MTLGQIRTRTIFAVSFAGSLGWLIDSYDFFLASASAVIVWPIIYFQAAGPSLAFTASILAYVLSFFMRPLAAILFGHWGDKIGRLRPLVWSLLTMGVGTFGIALTPTYATIGIAAPILIIVFRLLQGLGVGGEYGGGVSWASEFAANSRWRGFWTGWVQTSGQIGFTLGTVAILLTTSSLPRAAFLDWGWRIPFLIGGLVLVIGVVVRYKLTESPIFDSIAKKGAVERYPLIKLFKEEWKSFLLLVGVTMLISNTVITGPPYYVSLMSAYGFSPAFTGYTFLVGGIPGIIAAAVATLLVDPVGRRRMILIGASGGILTAILSLYVVTTRNPALILLGLSVYSITYRLAYPAVPAIAAEALATRYRFTGTGLAYGIGQSLVAATVLFVPYVIGSVGIANSWIYMGTIATVALIISAFCAALLKETKGSSLTD